MRCPRRCPYFYDMAANHFYAEFGTHFAAPSGEAAYAVLNAAVVDAATVQWSVDPFFLGYSL